MLTLTNPRWAELEHAYGNATDIPALLQQLAGTPIGNEEPWNSLWSSLAHQGDVYSASFAAVPHVVEALSFAPLKVDFNYFQFPAWVEICRGKNGIPVPVDLAPAYFKALSQLPQLAAAASDREWDEALLQAVFAAIAVSKKQLVIAEASLELTSEVAEEFMEWFFER